MQIAAAETGGDDTDLDFVWGWRREIPSFLDDVNVAIVLRQG